MVLKVTSKLALTLSLLAALYVPALAQPMNDFDLVQPPDYGAVPAPEQNAPMGNGFLETLFGLKQRPAPVPQANAFPVRCALPEEATAMEQARTLLACYRKQDPSYTVMTYEERMAQVRDTVRAYRQVEMDARTLTVPKS